MQGGWLPLVVAVVLFTLMTTWRTGRQIVAERLASRAVPLSTSSSRCVDAMQPARVPGTAVYMTAQGSGTPPALVHNLQYNKVLHERVVILNVVTVQQPHCARRRARSPWRCSGTDSSTCACSTDSWRIRTCRARCWRRRGRWA